MAFSQLSGYGRLRNLRYKQPMGLAFPGFSAGSDRHPGCCVHRPHRAAAAGHHGQHHDLQRRGVRIRSLAGNNPSWAQYLDVDPNSPESFLGYTLAGFAAWLSDQELVSIRRRTKAALENPKADGKKLVTPRRLPEEQGGRG